MMRFRLLAGATSVLLLLAGGCACGVRGTASVAVSAGSAPCTNVMRVGPTIASEASLRDGDDLVVGDTG